MVERLADRFGDQSANPSCLELVEFEIEIGESGSDAGEDLGLWSHPEEMEEDVLRAGGVLEDGEDRRDRAAEVVGVEGHGDVDGGVGCGDGGGGA